MEGIAATGAISPDRPERRRRAIATGRGGLLNARIGAVTVLAAVVLVWGGGASSATLYGLIIATIYAIAILGNNAITATLGEINLGTGAFLAVGAYGTAYAVAKGVPLEVAILASMIGAAVLGAILAVPTVRLTGVFTALVTFALAFAVPDLVVQLKTFTGGQIGRSAPVGHTIFGVQAGKATFDWLLVVMVAFWALAVVSLLLFHGRIGRSLLTIGEGGAAAPSFGTRKRFWEVAVWTWAAALGALAGAAYGLTVGYISPGLFPVTLSIILLVGGLVGGSRSAIGAWIGGAFVGLLPQEIQSVVPTEATSLMFGVVLYLTLLTGGVGVGGLIERAFVRVEGTVRRSAHGER